MEQVPLDRLRLSDDDGPGSKGKGKAKAPAEPGPKPIVTPPSAPNHAEDKLAVALEVQQHLDATMTSLRALSNRSESLMGLGARSQVTSVTKALTAAHAENAVLTKPSLPAAEQRTFALFPMLPPELRLQVWEASFAGSHRVVELHKHRPHYANLDNPLQAAPWRGGGRGAGPAVDGSSGSGSLVRFRTRSRNPAALAVNAEARAAAIRWYRVVLPVYADSGKNDFSSRPVPRPLYLDPERDTVAVLGELSYVHMMELLKAVKWRDPGPPKARRSSRRPEDGLGTPLGLKSLGLSWTCFAHTAGGDAMQIWARSVFKDLDELVLIMLNGTVPPGDWTVGYCELYDCETTDYYKNFEKGRGAQLRVGDEWMVVGKRPLVVRDLMYYRGWP